MQLFEGGILTKMTEEEYERLGEKLRAAAGIGKSKEDIDKAKTDAEVELFHPTKALDTRRRIE